MQKPSITTQKKKTWEETIPTMVHAQLWQTFSENWDIQHLLQYMRMMKDICWYRL
nr:MAG TPA_asm: hypothetical protein [Caudoviricetes sp.]